MSELNPKLTLDNFVIGEPNRFAYGAIKEVAQNPGGVYNPLLVHSGVGLGRSHLLHAVGNEIRTNYPAKRVLLFRGDELVNMSPRFAELLECDLLLLDDVQVLSGKVEAQEALLRVFETLLSHGRQIVLTSDRHLAELDFSPRLLSRIEGGLVAEIFPPDFGLKLEILKAKSKGKEIPPEVLEEVAKRLVLSIRELEGALNRVLAYSTFTSTPLSTELVEVLLSQAKPEAEEVREEPPARETEFSQFVTDMREDLSETMAKAKEDMRLREEYREKIYVWEMKGFDVSRLKSVIDGDIQDIAGEFVSFTNDVQRLMVLQREFGATDKKPFPEEARAIEEKLFNPNLVSEAEKELTVLKEKLRARERLMANLVAGYTFETFAVSETNREAVTACKRMAELQEGPTSLLITGNPGVGKTHLLNSIGNSLAKSKPQITLFCLLPDTLEREIRESLAMGERFVLRYGTVDLFLIDGIDSLLTGGGEEEGLYAVLRELAVGGRRVVLTSRKSLDQFPEKFRDLLARGSVVAIPSFDLHLREEVLGRIAREKGVELGDEVVGLLAGRLEGNFRDLEEGFKAVMSHASGGRPIDEDLISRLFPEVASETVAVEAIAAPEAPAEEVAVSTAESELIRTRKNKYILDWPLDDERLVEKY